MSIRYRLEEKAGFEAVSHTNNVVHTNLSFSHQLSRSLSPPRRRSSSCVCARGSLTFLLRNPECLA